MGGQLLILDEIHNQPDFARDLKTIWDFLDINVIFSDSSALHLDNADLSRRVLKYKLPTLKGDFFVDDQYIFEVGGKDKGYKQIQQLNNAFIAADNIEVGFNHKIPLWLFGFLC